MKKLISLVLLTVLACNVHAQTTKGTVAITAALGYTQQIGSTDKELNGEFFKSKNYNYTIAPSIGMFIKDNLELGTSFSFYEDRTENITPYVDHVNNYKSESQVKSYRLYARQYKFLTDKFAISGTLSGGMSSRNDSFSTTDVVGQQANRIDKRDEQHNTFSAALSPGLSFFPSSNFGISLNLGALAYSRRKVEGMSYSEDGHFPPRTNGFTYKSNILELDLSSMNLNLGLTYFIGK